MGFRPPSAKGHAEGFWWIELWQAGYYQIRGKCQASLPKARCPLIQPLIFNKPLGSAAK
jgi:hypothetical protein